MILSALPFPPLIVKELLKEDIQKHYQCVVVENVETLMNPRDHVSLVDIQYSKVESLLLMIAEAGAKAAIVGAEVDYSQSQN